MSEFEKALKYFYDKEYEIEIENKRFVNFDNGLYCTYWFDYELDTFNFDSFEVTIDEAYYSSVFVKEMDKDDKGIKVSNFIEKCDAIYPGYVKEVIVEY